MLLSSALWRSHSLHQLKWDCFSTMFSAVRSRLNSPCLCSVHLQKLGRKQSVQQHVQLHSEVRAHVSGCMYVASFSCFYQAPLPVLAS